MSEARKADPDGIVVAALLALTAAVIAWDAGRLELGQTYGLGPKAMPYVIAAGLVLIAIIGFGGGFIPATTVLFTMTAAAFGRRAFLVDLAIGFVLAFVIYLMFDKLLTLSLPAGPLERLL